FYQNLVAGKSAISRWRGLDTSNIYTKVGGDLSDYNVEGKLATLADQLPTELFKRVRKMVRTATFSTRLTVLCVVDAWLNAGLPSLNLEEVAIIVGGHNFYPNYDYKVHRQFFADPELFDEQYAYKGLDTDQAASIGEVLGITGPVYTVGGACASTLLALRSA